MTRSDFKTAFDTLLVPRSTQADNLV